MRITKPLAALAAVGLTVAVASPTLATRYGKPDGDDHPYVGLMVAGDINDETGEFEPLWRCSGTLVDITSSPPGSAPTARRPWRSGSRRT